MVPSGPDGSLSAARGKARAAVAKVSTAREKPADSSCFLRARDQVIRENPNAARGFAGAPKNRQRISVQRISVRVKIYGASWAQVYTVMYTWRSAPPHPQAHIARLASLNLYQYHWAEGVKFMLGGLPSSGRSTDSLDRLDGMYGS